MILDDASAVINSVDLSASVRGLTFKQGNRMEPASAMGDNYEGFEKSLQTATLVIQFWQDFTTGGVDETLRALLSDADGFTVVLKPTSAAVSATNPSYTMTMNLADYDEIAGEIGDRLVAAAEFALDEGSSVTVATS
jgi:hypothetical protein